MLDSHVDLVTYFKLPDETAYIHRFAKVELTPVDWADASTWTWKVDEPTLPAWWSDVAARAESTLRSRASRMILKDGEHTLIVDGCWIVAGTAKVRDVRSGWIRRVQDWARVSDVWDSAQVSGVRDSARVSGVRDSARVSDVGGSARVSGVWDSALVSDVRDSARVSGVRDSARVSGVWGSAQVSDVRDSAQVSDVRDWARVSGVWGSAQVSDVWGSAQVSDVWPDVVLDASAKAHLVQTVTT
jgi:hypothetical protein